MPLFDAIRSRINQAFEVQQITLRVHLIQLQCHTDGLGRDRVSPLHPNVVRSDVLPFVIQFFHRLRRMKEIRERDKREIREREKERERERSETLEENYDWHNQTEPKTCDHANKYEVQDLNNEVRMNHAALNMCFIITAFPSQRPGPA